MREVPLAGKPRSVRRARDGKHAAPASARAWEVWSDRAATRLRAVVNWCAAHPRAPLGVALVFAVVVRLFLVARTGAMIDGDEALVGIQAESILRGARPVYFYAQPYMGSLEAYLVAIVFAVVGPSAWALRLVPLLLSLPLVYVTWRLALVVVPRGRARAFYAGLAALVAAAPPLYDAVAELRAWGGQIEVYLLSLALLLSAVELVERSHAGMRPFERSRRWAILGLLAGLGIWVNPLIVYALLACALYLLIPVIPVALQWWRTRRVAFRAATLLPILAFLPGLALGGLPAWLYALHSGGANLAVYLTQPMVSPAVSGAARHGRLFLGAAITARYATCVAPRVLDGGLPAEGLALLPLRWLLLLPPLAGTVGALFLAWRRARGHRGGVLRPEMPLLYAGVVTAVFCLGTSAWASTKACNLDLAGRYAVPLALVEPFLLLGLLALPGIVAGVLQQRAPRLSALRRRQALALGVLVVAGALQLLTYPSASPTQTFQSPYYGRIPANTGALIAYLRSHHITDAWANHWLGNIVTFETDGQITCADYYDQVVQGGLRRPPGTIAAVAAAPRASFILLTLDPHPILAQELAAQHVAFTQVALPDAGVTIITPAVRVNPATVVAGLGQDYAS